VSRFVAGSSTGTSPAPVGLVRGRAQEGPEDVSELAYTALGFPECPACERRVTPEGAPPFCRWLREGAPDPFAALVSFRESLP